MVVLVFRSLVAMPAVADLALVGFGDRAADTRSSSQMQLVCVGLRIVAASSMRWAPSKILARLSERRRGGARHVVLKVGDYPGRM